MSKVLLINGSPHEFGCTYTALKEVADTLEKNGVETEFLYLGDQARGRLHSLRQMQPDREMHL